jgi:hypothetical protein
MPWQQLLHCLQQLACFLMAFLLLLLLAALPLQLLHQHRQRQQEPCLR